MWDRRPRRSILSNIRLMYDRRRRRSHTPRQTRVGEKCALAETVVCVMEPVDGVATRARVAGGRIALGVWLRLCRAILGAPSGFS